MMNGLHRGGLNPRPLSHEYSTLPLVQGVLPKGGCTLRMVGLGYKTELQIIV
jgi:hypothetical protein